MPTKHKLYCLNNSALFWMLCYNDNIIVWRGNNCLCVILNYSSQISSTVKRSGIERENKKGLTSRETAIPLWFDLFQSSHIWLSYLSRCFRNRIWEVVICLNCIIGLSSTTENNSLCNHIKWWQIVLKIKSRKRHWKRRIHI